MSRLGVATSLMDFNLKKIESQGKDKLAVRVNQEDLKVFGRQFG
jgi:hypothetical protein